MFSDLRNTEYWNDMERMVWFGLWSEPAVKCAHYVYCGATIPVKYGVFAHGVYNVWPPKLCDLCSGYEPHFEKSFIGPHSCDGCFPGIVHILNSSKIVREAVIGHIRFLVEPDLSHLHQRTVVCGSLEDTMQH